MKQSFLDYSMSVIVQRALPDVRDGLKPVHRRILYAMSEAGLSPTQPFKKSATVVGDVLGKYHPHGDSAVYDALVRMVQDFSLRYPLIDGQGNFGSIDGDSAAAYRYTEARLSPIAMEILADIDRDTVAFAPNFDDRLKEPTVLPARVPNLLVNGSSGIAFGMSTNIPPHNLREVVLAAIHLLDHPECTIDELMEIVPGPDFPTGGLIVGREGIRQAYHTGRGRVVMQGRIGRETRRGGREQLVVTEIPYATNKTRLIEQVVDLVKKGRTPDISDLRDESDRDGIRLVIELKRGADAKKVVRAILKWTSLQSTFGVISLALDNGVPQEFGLKEMLERFRDHRIEVIVRRSQWEREKAAAEAHVLEGLMIALKNIDRVVAIIRGSQRRDTAAEKLRKEFKLTQIQADAILMMRLYRLTQLETKDLKAKLDKLLARIAELDALLADRSLQEAEIRQELQEILEKYGDARRTRIVDGKPESLIESMVAQEEVIVVGSHHGFLKQIPMYLYRRRLSTGKSVSEMERFPDDFIEYLFPANTSDTLLFFTPGGRAHSLEVADIPESDRGSRGKSTQQLLGIGKDERIANLISLARVSQENEAQLVFVTKQGSVKRTSLSQFLSMRSGGAHAINLREGDRLLDVHLMERRADLLLISSEGRAIRFEVEAVPEMGRTAQGVRGMKLPASQRIVGSVLVRRDAEVCAISEKGLGRRIAFAEFPIQRRDGRGMVAFPVDKRSGGIVGAIEVLPGDELMVVGQAENDAVTLPTRFSADSVTAGSLGDALEPAVKSEKGVSFQLLTRAAERAVPVEGPGPDGGAPGPVDGATDVPAVESVGGLPADEAMAPEGTGPATATALLDTPVQTLEMDGVPTEAEAVDPAEAIAKVGSGSAKPAAESDRLPSDEALTAEDPGHASESAADGAEESKPPVRPAPKRRKKRGSAPAVEPEAEAEAAAEAEAQEAPPSRPARRGKKKDAPKDASTADPPSARKPSDSSGPPSGSSGSGQFDLL